MQLNVDALKSLEKRFDIVLRELPEARRDLLERMGQKALDALRGEIGGSGKLQRWQDVHIGSLGGYAAVRPKAKTYDEHGFSVGAITTAYEYGHVQKKGRYVPAIGKRLTADRVEGRWPYARTKRQIDQIALPEAENFLRRLKEKLEDD